MKQDILFIVIMAAVAVGRIVYIGPAVVGNAVVKTARSWGSWD